ncbi:hypothetical protein OHB13_22195 [Streptomyces sp. NBC_00440]
MAAFAAGVNVSVAGPKSSASFTGTRFWSSQRLAAPPLTSTVP